MGISLHHFFLLTDKPDELAAKVAESGLIEGSSNDHPGQGTANRRFFFPGSAFEILYVRDAFEASNGPASGMTSGDIGVNEASSTSVGYSLQRTGTGAKPEDFTWTGPDPATNVDVTDALPAGVNFVSASATAGSYSSGTGIWDLASIANAASDTLTITATVDSAAGGTTITNTAAVTALDQTDGNAANDSDSVDIDVLAAGGEVQITTASTDARPSWAPGGTQLVFDAGPGDSDPVDLTVVGDRMFFVTERATAPKLWRTNGLPGGTSLLAAFAAGSQPAALTAVGHTLFMCWSTQRTGFCTTSITCGLSCTTANRSDE